MLVTDGLFSRQRLPHAGVELEAQAIARHLEDAAAWFAHRRLKIPARVAVNIEHLTFGIDDGGRRDVLLEEHLLGEVAHAHAQRHRLKRRTQPTDRAEVVRRHRRGQQLPRRDGASALEQFPLLVDCGEEIRGGAHRLRTAKEQVTARIERVMEERHELLLQEGVHVDEQVAAADQVDPREGRILGDVLLGEDKAISNRLDHAVALAVLDEEARQALGRDIGTDARGIDSGSRTLDGLGIDIGREHLHRHVALDVACSLQDQHGDRVRLLTRGATGHPHADRVARGVDGDQPGNRIGSKRLERGRVAE